MRFRATETSATQPVPYNGIWNFTGNLAGLLKTWLSLILLKKYEPKCCWRLNIPNVQRMRPRTLESHWRLDSRNMDIEDLLILFGAGQDSANKSRTPIAVMPVDQWIPDM
jgi:hypothetical protein